MTSLRLPLAVTAALLAFSAAHAAPHGRTAFITDYDLDKDGSVSSAEFKTVRDQRFAGMDTNRDGGVDEAEYVGEYTARLDAQLAASKDTAEKKAQERAGQLKQAHVRFGVLDKDRTGKIELAEFSASGVRAFAEQDGDGDGKVVPEEPKTGEPRA